MTGDGYIQVSKGSAERAMEDLFSGLDPAVFKGLAQAMAKWNAPGFLVRTLGMTFDQFDAEMDKWRPREAE